jgi:hypothetical protein
MCYTPYISLIILRVFSVVRPQGKVCSKVCSGCRRMLKNVSKPFIHYLFWADFFSLFSRALMCLQSSHSSLPTFFSLLYPIMFC